ncbi:MAG: cupin domain-containing protein [Candidatus Dadabacteria bacterium]|nr:cupin domain-containing protein [Candidatus Dadabacteria bacterium]
MSVKSIDEVKKEEVTAGKHTTRQVLIGPKDAPNFAMRRFVIKPGGSMPRHKNSVEHEQYVLSGRARIGIGEKVYEVKKDDTVYIPAGTPHWYECIGDEPFEFICVVPNDEDKIELIEESSC